MRFSERRLHDIFAHKLAACGGVHAVVMGGKHMGLGWIQYAVVLVYFAVVVGVETYAEGRITWTTVAIGLDAAIGEIL